MTERRAHIVEEERRLAEFSDNLAGHFVLRLGQQLLSRLRCRFGFDIRYRLVLGLSDRLVRVVIINTHPVTGLQVVNVERELGGLPGRRAIAGFVLDPPDLVPSALPTPYRQTVDPELLLGGPVEI